MLYFPFICMWCKNWNKPFAELNAGILQGLDHITLIMSITTVRYLVQHACQSFQEDKDNVAELEWNNRWFK